MRVAGILGFLGVALGAFGAHGLKGWLEPMADGAQRLAWWNTGVQYHLWHALLLVGFALLPSTKTTRVGAALAVTGIALFSGSLYLMTLTGIRVLGAVTPFGGLAFLGAWVCVAVAGRKAVAGAALVVVLTGSSACSMHRVTLAPSPDASAPLSQRDHYYAEHRSVGVAGQPIGGGFAQTPFPFLQLANGQRVVDPLDVLPAVGPESLAGAAARKAADNGAFAGIVLSGGFGAYTLGATGLLLGLVAAPFGGDATSAALAIGGAGLLSLGLVGVVFGADLAEQAEMDKMSAFLLYDEALRKRLKLRTREEAGRAEDRWHVDAPIVPPPSKSTDPPPPINDPSSTP